MTNRYDYKYFCNFYNRYKYKFKYIYDTDFLPLIDTVSAILPSSDYMRIYAIAQLCYFMLPLNVYYAAINLSCYYAAVMLLFLKSIMLLLCYYYAAINFKSLLCCYYVVIMLTLM